MIVLGGDKWATGSHAAAKTNGPVHGESHRKRHARGEVGLHGEDVGYRAVDGILNIVHHEGAAEIGAEGEKVRQGHEPVQEGAVAPNHR